jgi:N-acyl homoserine lactone hydrolase
VDTGVGPRHPIIDDLYEPRRVSVTDALRAVNCRLEQIALLVNTHLHFDHCGENAAFPGIPIFVQQREWSAAQDEQYTIREWVEFEGATYRQLRGDSEIAHGVRVVAAPGHTPGHQSVLASTDGGLVIIAGQCVETLDDWNAVATGEDVAGYLSEPARALQLLRPRRVLFSHDERCWDASTDNTPAA